MGIDMNVNTFVRIWAITSTIACLFLTYKQLYHSQMIERSLVERNAIRQRLDSVELQHAFCQQQVLTQSDYRNRNHRNNKDQSSTYSKEPTNIEEPNEKLWNDNNDSFEEEEEGVDYELLKEAKTNEEVRAANKMFESLIHSNHHTNNHKEKNIINSREANNKNKKIKNDNVINNVIVDYNGEKIIETSIPKEKVPSKNKKIINIPVNISSITNKRSSIMTSTTIETIKTQTTILTKEDLIKMEELELEKKKKNKEIGEEMNTLEKSNSEEVKPINSYIEMNIVKKESIEEMRKAASLRRALKRKEKNVEALKDINQREEDDDDDDDDDDEKMMKYIEKETKSQTKRSDEEDDDEDDIPVRDKAKSLVKDFSTSSFESALDNYDFIFVDFHAPWCDHCRKLLVELDKVAESVANLESPKSTLLVGEVDCMKHRNLCSEIDSVPKLWLFRNRNAVLEGVASIHRFIEYVGPRQAKDMFKWLMTTSHILNSFQDESYKEASKSWFPSSSGTSDVSSSSPSSSSKHRHHLFSGSYQLPSGVSGGLPAASSPSVSERNVILSLSPAKEVSVAFWNLCEGEVGLHWLNREILDNGLTNSPALTQVRLIDPSEEVEMLTYTGHTFFIVSDGGQGLRLLRFTILPNVDRYVAMFCAEALEEANKANRGI